MFQTTVLQKMKRLGRLGPPDQKGQSLVIIAFAFLGLIAMLGLALDLGLVYIERTRIKRAVDAATLAAVSELPHEEKAILRAINYLDQNGYDLRDNNGNPQVNIYVRGCAHDGYLKTAGTLSNRGADLDADPYLYFPTIGVPVADPKAEFVIDTRTYQSKESDGSFFPDSEQCDETNDIFGTAGKIHVDATVPVNMNFMQFFGFRRVPVWDEAIAQNVTNLDVAVVFDMSGSMQFDTICYGCYEPFGDGTTDWDDLSYGNDFPNTSFIHPIPTKHLPKTNAGDSNQSNIPGANNSGKLCADRDGNVVQYYTVTGGSARRYIIIEAELYSLNTSLLAGPFRQPGRGYWAIQHTNWRTVHRMMNENWDPDSSYQVGANPILSSYSTGSWVSHNPYVSWAIDPNPPDFAGVPFGHDYTLDEVRNNPNDVPSLEYDFITSSQPSFLWDDSSEATHIWARVQAGGNDFSIGNRDIYWAVYEHSDLYGAAGGDPTLATPLGSGQIQPARQTPNTEGANYGGADAGRWRWVELTGSGPALDLEDSTKTKYVLKIWAGGVGYDIDQIVIGNRNDKSFTTDYNNGVVAREQATEGSAFRQACNRCNPIYGLTVNAADCVFPKDNGTSTVPEDGWDLSNPTNNRLFSGYQPIRDAKEAVKRFISKLDPQFDQAGIVSYSTNTPSAGRVELRCKRYLSADQCYRGATPISYTDVIDVLEILPPDGSTNMAQGMLRGLEALGINADNRASFDNTCTDATDHCGRGGSARRVMVLMTDGVANKNPRNQGGSSVNCYANDLYQPNLGDDSKGGDSEDRAKDCVVYYAQIAAANNVTIYTIGLGNGADTNLLETVANLSDGQYFAAVSPTQLDGIFDAILQSVSVRLIQ